MFTTSRNGVAAKKVERELGVTYKTAWRMCNLIRQYMGFVDGDMPLGGKGRGIVETDIAYIGGKDKMGEDDKAIVLGAVERRGEVITAVIPNRSEWAIIQPLKRWVRPSARIASDEEKGFRNLGDMGFQHGIVNHSQKQWTNGDYHTNSIEGFWANVKRGIEGTHIHVSKKWLQTYLWEFEFRHNYRKRPHHMMNALLRAFPRPVLKP